MSHVLSIDAALKVREGVVTDDLHFDNAPWEAYFSKWGYDPKSNTYDITGLVETNGVISYLRNVHHLLNEFVPYVCDGEDVYVIDEDASWPAGWRFVFKDGEVVCYEGMMVFIDEVKM